MKLADAYIDVSARGLSGVHRDFSGLQTSMRQYLGVAGVMGVVGGVTKAFMDFDEAMRQVQTIWRQSPQDARKLREEILELSYELGRTPVGLATALYHVASAQFGVKNSSDLLREGHRLAIATASDYEMTVRLLVGAMKAYGIEAKDSEQVSSSFFKLIDRGRPRLDELLDTIGRVTTLSNQMGLSLDQMNALLAIFTRRGIGADLAVTGLRAILSQILVPGEEDIKMANRLGVTFDLAKIKTMGWVEWLRQLKEATGGNEAVLGRMFKNLRGISPLLSVVGKGTESLAEETEYWKNKIEDLNLAAEEMEKAPKRAIDRFFKAFKSNLTDIGNQLAELAGLGAPAAPTVAGKTLRELYETQIGVEQERMRKAKPGERDRHARNIKRWRQKLDALEGIETGRYKILRPEFQPGAVERWAPREGVTYPEGRMVYKDITKSLDESEALRKVTRYLEKKEGENTQEALNRIIQLLADLLGLQHGV